MTRADAENIYYKLSPEDRHLMGIIGVLFSYEFAWVIWKRLYRIILKKEDSIDES